MSFVTNLKPFYTRISLILSNVSPTSWPHTMCWHIRCLALFLGSDIYVDCCLLITKPEDIMKVKKIVYWYVSVKRICDLQW